MRIENFLFQENIEQTLAEFLIDKFPNLSFNTSVEFFDFFESRNIKLIKKPDDPTRSYEPNKNLLERMKNFKSSTDYDFVKKYIANQARIKNEINKGNIQQATILLDEARLNQVDPFFNSIVRKLLTGSETGLLPSEELQDLLSTLTNTNKKEIDINADITRDETGQIISFENYLRNRGSVVVEFLDERISIENLNYVVNRNFEQIPNAINASQTIFEKAQAITDILSDGGDEITEDKLVKGLEELLLADTTSQIAMENKINELEAEIERKDADIQTVKEVNEELNDIIDELVMKQRMIQDDSNSKDETIIALGDFVDSTLSDLEGQVSEQLTNTADAFDALATKIEAQAEKQNKALEKLAEALTPKEPEPEPDNPAGDIIKQILEKWENVSVITQNTYNTFDAIMNDLGIKDKPVKSSYVFVPRANTNLFNPSEEIKQHLKWNNEIKKQIKETFIDVTDEAKAKKILANIDILLKDSEGSLNNKALKDTIGDALIEWAKDRARIRGSFAKTIRKVGEDLGITSQETFKYSGGRYTQVWGSVNWDNFGATEPSVVSMAEGVALFITSKLPNDKSGLINTLTLLDGIKQAGAGFPW